MVNVETVTCPDCLGAGEQEVHISPGQDGRTVRHKCFRCTGSGKCSRDMLLWIAKGDELRKHRIERNLNQTGVSRRMGITVHELQQMETGRVNPQPLLDHWMEYEKQLNRVVDSRRD